MDYWRGGKFRRVVRGSRFKKENGDIIMGLNPAIGSPENGIYPRVNLPTPPFNDITERLVDSFELVDGKSVRTRTVEPHPQAIQRQADHDAREVKRQADENVAGDIVGDSVVKLLDEGTARQIKTRIKQAIPDNPATDGVRTVITKLALALADTRRK